MRRIYVEININLNPLGFKRYALTFAFLIYTLMLFSSGCNRFGNLPKNVIAEVNNETITLNDFNKEFKGMMLENQMGSDPNIKRLKETFLNQIIERKILIQEAKRLGISVSKEEVDQVIQEIKLDYKEAEFIEKLKLIGMNLDEWRNRIEEKLLAEKMIRSASSYQGDVDEREALKFYEDHRAYFQIPEMVRVRQIVVADGEEAIQILKRLKRGESFEKLAKEKSIGLERDIGGDLGYFSRGERPSEFDHVFEMEVGRISEVIKTPYGYHIFKLEEKIEPREIPFNEVRTKIIQTIIKRKGEERFQEWLKKLKAKSHIKINKEWLNS